MKRILALCLLLSCLTVLAAAEGLAGLDLVPTVDPALPADELLLASFGSDLALELKFTDETLSDELDGRKEQGYLFLRLDFTVANYDFDDADLYKQISAALVYDGAYRYEGGKAFERSPLGMLEESGGSFTFRVPGAVMADRSDRLKLELQLGDAGGSIYINVGERAASYGYREMPASGSTGFVFNETFATIQSAYGDESDEAFRYVVVSADLINNTDTERPVNGLIEAALSYQRAYVYPASVVSARETIAPLEAQRVDLVFKVPYLVAKAEDGAVSLTVTLDGQPQERAFSMADAAPKGHAYRVFNDPMDWDKAKAACESYGGHLVTITTPAEDEFCKNLIPDNKGYYLGGYADKDREWHWVTEERFSYYGWGGDQPNNNGGKQNYLEYAKDQKKMWGDAENDHTRFGQSGFICEWDDSRLCPFGDYSLRETDEANLQDAPYFAYAAVADETGFLTGVRHAVRYASKAADAKDTYTMLDIFLNVINPCTEPAMLGAAEAELSFRGRYSFVPEITGTGVVLAPLQVAKLKLSFYIPKMVADGKEDEVVLSLKLNGELTETGFKVGDIVAPSSYGHCYSIRYWFKGSTTDWKTTNNYIKDNYGKGYLATITNPEEAAFLKSKSAYYVTRRWLGATYSNGAWKWVTGEPWGDFADWGHEDPNKEKDYPYLGTYADGTWGNFKNDKQEIIGFIVEWDDISQVPADIDPFVFEF